MSFLEKNKRTSERTTGRERGAATWCVREASRSCQRNGGSETTTPSVLHLLRPQCIHRVFSSLGGDRRCSQSTLQCLPYSGASNRTQTAGIHCTCLISRVQEAAPTKRTPYCTTSKSCGSRHRCTHNNGKSRPAAAHTLWVWACRGYQHCSCLWFCPIHAPLATLGAIKLAHLMKLTAAYTSRVRARVRHVQF